MKKHIQIVAALHIALGALSLLAAIVVFVVFAMAGGIVISQGERQAAGILGIEAQSCVQCACDIGLVSVLYGFAATLRLPFFRL